MQDILESLNAEQRKAATHIDGALLILAGAGSGKTKTLTTRLAYLIKEVGIPPSATLTLTFTNKAANEMRQRALALLENQIAYPPLLCTFHRFGLLFLRQHIHYLGRKADFVLIDSDDQKRIAKKLDETLSYGMILHYISSQKNILITPQSSLLGEKTPQQKALANAYKHYCEFLEKNNMVDYDDLLLLSYRILDSSEQIAIAESQKYQYIMVDEYQDTNYLQVALLKKLCTTHQNICVVGDDDQSIYSWRGADINYILGFKDTFRKAQLIKLETNYRYKEPILKAANALIAHNSQRLGKQLKSHNATDEHDINIISYINSADEVQEADTIAKEIKSLIDSGVKPQEIAILFRLNALSRSLEEGLNRAKIPYRLIGATRFYERMEIKDILAYFRMVLNINDDFSLARIINTPKRGIGKVAQTKIFQLAQNLNISVYEALSQNKLDSILSPTQKLALENLFEDIKDLAQILKESPLRFLEQFDERIKILGEGKNKNDDIDREANIQEFYGYFRDYVICNPLCTLEDFLSDLSLSSDMDAPIEESVCLMSVHSSKGLEFDCVFVIGLEEDFLPLNREDGDLQEERRLGYVAFTRARHRLIVSSVNSRFYKGRRTQLESSRFLFEAGILGKKHDNTPKSAHNSKAFTKGAIVSHKIFGRGIVLEVMGDKLRINFGGNERLIMADFIQRAE